MPHTIWTILFTPNCFATAIAVLITVTWVWIWAGITQSAVIVP